MVRRHHKRLTKPRMILPGVVAASGGGGGSPTPAVKADFENGVYAINGVSKMMLQIFEENLNVDAFNQSLIVSGAGMGMQCKIINSSGTSSLSCTPVLTAAAKAGLLNGFVVVLDRTLTHSGDAGCQVYTSIDLLQLPDYTMDWSCETFAFDPSSSVTADLADEIDPRTAISGFGFGRGKTAALFSDATLAFSVDGGAVTERLNPNKPASPTDVDVYCTATAADGKSAEATIHSIKWFAPGTYTTADLPALSAP